MEEPLASDVQQSPGQDSRTVIEARGLTKRYEDGTLALDALELSVRAGEIYCLLGANGAGKTTALNLFLGFVPATAGRCLVMGEDTLGDPRARRHMAYLSESVELYGNFSARWNLGFFARLAGRNNLRRGDYDRALREVSLPERSFERKVRTFSKGMRQKLGLAITMIKDAPALFLDEPLSGLDPRAAQEVATALLELRDRGKAILTSTHDVFRMRDLADRVGILKEGRKVIELRREQLVDEDLEKLYFDYVGGMLPFHLSPLACAAELPTRRMT